MDGRKLRDQRIAGFLKIQPYTKTQKKEYEV
jgi:hypothetical protein